MASLMDDILARYEQRRTQMQGQYPSEREMRRFAPPIGGASPPSWAGGFSPIMPPTTPMQMTPVRPMDSTLFGEDVGPRPLPMRAIDSTLAGYDMPAPMQPSRSANMGGPTAPGAPMQLASAAPSVRESFMQRLLGGPVYQSNGMPLLAQPQGPTPSGATLPPAMQATTPQQINFGNPDNPADFVRADRALMGLPEDALRIAGLLG